MIPNKGGIDGCLDPQTSGTVETKAMETTGGLSRPPHSPSQKTSVNDLFTASYLPCIEGMESRGCGWLSLAIRRASPEWQSTQIRSCLAIHHCERGSEKDRLSGASETSPEWG